MVSVNDNITGLLARLPSPTPEYRPLSYSGIRPDFQKKIAQSAQKRIVPEEVRNTGFRIELEKHIDDVKKSKAYLSKEVGKDIKLRHQINSSELNQSLPAAGSKYSGYYSALNYEQRARFTTGVNEANKYIEHIQSASSEPNAFEKFLAAQPIPTVAGVLVDQET